MGIKYGTDMGLKCGTKRIWDKMRNETDMGIKCRHGDNKSEFRFRPVSKRICSPF